VTICNRKIGRRDKRLSKYSYIDEETGLEEEDGPGEFIFGWLGKIRNCTAVRVPRQLSFPRRKIVFSPPFIGRKPDASPSLFGEKGGKIVSSGS